MNSDDIPSQVVRLKPADGRPARRKRSTVLTPEERRILIAELAEIAAELDVLQERTAEIAARVAPHTTIHLARPA
jgi:hypothetical protein